MRDSMRLPPAVLSAFLKGEWTVSVTGKPYHSQAMDEAHESMINKSTKDLTTRPTLYRLIELENFSAVLTKVWNGLKRTAFKFSKKKRSMKKLQQRSICVPSLRK